MSQVIDTRKEPAVFDVVDKVVSAKWLDWYVFGKLTEETTPVTDEASIQKLREKWYKIGMELGHEKIGNMIGYLEQELNKPGFKHPVLLIQKQELLEDLQEYEKAINLLQEWRSKGFLNFITPDQPSIFTGNPYSVGAVRQWLEGNFRETKLRPHYFKMYGLAMSEAIMAISREQAAAIEAPALNSKLNGVPSLLWVLVEWSKTPEGSYKDAHVIGELLLEKESDENRLQ